MTTAESALAGRPVRIWFQSFTDPVVHAPYLHRLKSFLQRVAGPGVSYHVHGMRPADVHLGRLSEYRCAARAIVNAVVAEQEGYDGVLLGHFQDAGLYEARCSVDIPVTGLGEASMLHACTLAGRIGLVGIDPVYVPYHREQIRRYGLEARVVAVAAMRMAPAEAIAACDDREAFEAIARRFAAAARPLVRAEAVELVMSAGGLFAVLCDIHGDIDVDGIPVVNPALLAVKQAEAAVAAARAGTVRTSRAATFSRSPETAVEELLELIGAESLADASAEARRNSLQ